MSSLPSKGGHSAGYLATLTREELIDRVKQLEDQVVRMRPLLSTSPDNFADAIASSQSSKVRPGRRIREGRVDFKQFRQRRVALRIAYLGWAFDGSAMQDNTDNTVLGRLCEGLKRVQLIESADSCNLVSCARTDKGVSALANVVSVNIRSLLADCSTGCVPGSGPDIHSRRKPPLTEDVEANEVDPIGPLNRVLPRELRVLAWAPVAPDFNARFACRSREYLYHFLRAEFDIEAMRDACQRFIGHHDFRNFSKFSPDQPNYERTVLECDIEPVEHDSTDDHRAMFAFRVKATAFLYHQIRNMFSVLALVGAGLEQPDIVNKLLDVDANPRKPEYVLADGLPLILSNTEFDGLEWRCSLEARQHIDTSLQRQWSESIVRSRLTRLALDHMPLRPATPNWLHLVSGLVPELRSRQHRPLLNRQLQVGFDEMRQRVDCKKRLKAGLEDETGVNQTEDNEMDALAEKRSRMEEC